MKDALDHKDTLVNVGPDAPEVVNEAETIYVYESEPHEPGQLSWPKSTSVLQLCANALLCGRILASKP